MISPSNKPTSFRVISSTNNIDGYYYNSKELMEYNKVFYYGFTSKPRMIIIKKNIKPVDYVYANLKKNEWVLTTSECKKAQLLLTKEWVDTFFFKIIPTNVNYIERNIQAVVSNKNTTIDETINEEEEEVVSNKNIIVDQTINNEEEEEVISNQNTVVDETINNDEEEVISNQNTIVYENINNKESDIEKECQEAPAILYLNKSEMFRDTDGNVVNVETRGEKNRNKIYFKVKDVSIGFEMPNLYTTIIDKRYNGYEINIDYKTFFNRVSLGLPQTNAIKKCLYLTYHGLLRVLYASNNKQVKRFQDWAEEILFTSHMGSKEEKLKLGTDIANINIKTYKAVFETYASKLPSIYLFLLGKVRLLRETFGIDQNIPDESSVYKYGCTDDLNRRFGETDAKYGKLHNVSVKISVFNMVDVKYIFNAERDIRELGNSNGIHLNVEGYNELIILDDKQLKQIKKQYQYIGNEWAGASLELQNQITELKEKIKDLENENNILQKQNTLEKTELKHIIELKDRDILSRDKELETNKRINDLELMNKDLQIKLLSSTFGKSTFEKG